MHAHLRAKKGFHLVLGKGRCGELDQLAEQLLLLIDTANVQNRLAREERETLAMLHM